MRNPSPSQSPFQNHFPHISGFRLPISTSNHAICTHHEQNAPSLTGPKPGPAYPFPCLQVRLRHKQRFVNQADESSPFPPEWNEIIASAVHDIRNPLSSMLTTLEILRHLTAGSDQAAKVIEMLDRQVTTVSDQLERLLRDPASFRRPPL